ASDKFVFKGHSFLFDKIMEMKNLTHEEIMAEFRRRVDVIRYAVEKDVQDFRELAGMIVKYYKEPIEEITKIREEMGWETEEVEI
ncbi:MAG: secretion system protein E, partial [Thermoplasmata archaeon]|nr:secretion system protein E [Thermoplasmata archaeon]